MTTESKTEYNPTMKVEKEPELSRGLGMDLFLLLPYIPIITL